jgi:hypothetical protein
MQEMNLEMLAICSGNQWKEREMVLGAVTHCLVQITEQEIGKTIVLAAMTIRRELGTAIFLQQLDQVGR